MKKILFIQSLLLFEKIGVIKNKMKQLIEVLNKL